VDKVHQEAGREHQAPGDSSGSQQQAAASEQCICEQVYWPRSYPPSYSYSYCVFYHDDDVCDGDDDVDDDE